MSKKTKYYFLECEDIILLTFGYIQNNYTSSSLQMNMIDVTSYEYCDS